MRRDEDIGASIQYYLIHGLDKKRKRFMEIQFRHAGVPSENVNWILSPNVGDPLPRDICNNPSLPESLMAISYKHYLCLEQIVASGEPVAVIVEDNVEFLSALPQKIAEYLRDLPENWDILFDSDFYGWKYEEGPLLPDVSVYEKSNESSQQCAGATKGVHFYMLSQKAAKTLYENYLPFGDGPDHHLNKIIMRHSLRCFWAEPPNVHKINRPSSWR